MSRLHAHAGRRPVLTDALVAVAVLGCTMLGIALVGPDGERPDAGWVTWLAYTASTVASVALVAARRHPQVVAMSTAFATVVTGALGFLLTPLLLAPVMVAFYWLAATRPSRGAWTWATVATVLIVVTAIGFDLDRSLPLRAVGPALWLLLPLALGHRVRLAAAHQAEEARRRVTEERIRIARDLHDVVAHHLAVAHAQAGTAAHMFDSDPALARALLSALQGSTSTAMLELRDTVGVLRDRESTLDLEPAPDLDRLPDLLDVHRSTGLTIALELHGHQRDVPAATGLTAYRIAQEALTNVGRHASTPSAVVALTYTDTTLRLSIRNTAEGTGATPHRPGFGIVGMTERAEAVGGRLDVRRSTGSFELTAILPAPVHSTPVAP